MTYYKTLQKEKGAWSFWEACHRGDFEHKGECLLKQTGEAECVRKNKGKSLPCWASGEGPSGKQKEGAKRSRIVCVGLKRNSETGRLLTSRE